VVIEMKTLNIKLKKGKLDGYSLKDSMSDRRKVLKKYVKIYGSGDVIKRLNILYIFNRNNYPTTANKFHRDMVFVQKLGRESAKRSTKRSVKKRSVKRSVKKRSTKRSTKRSVKKRSVKRSVKKRSTKRSVKKRSAKKRSAKKRSVKKRSAKRSVKKEKCKKEKRKEKNKK
jgi:Mg-chelatase subunit ChlI